jgi:uncharacterized membrane protein (UPF0127 family)
MLTALSLCTACDRPTGSAPAPIARDPGEPTEAQGKLRTMKLWLGGSELEAELALTPAQVRTGMMFRTNMAETEAMLFVFGMPHQASFWMKNTPLPLSLAYIDPEGVILEIHDLEPFNTNSVSAGTGRIQYVLETTQGWFQRHDVKAGMVVRTELGSLRDTFFSGKRPR